MSSRSKSRPPKEPEPAVLDAEQMRKGIKLLERRISNIEAFDPNTVTSRSNIPEVTQLQHSIDTTLIDIFGQNSLEYERYRGAAYFTTGPINMVRRGEPSVQEIRHYLEESKNKNLTVLKGAANTLREKLADYEESDVVESIKTPRASDYARKAFIVHGHDVSCRDAVELFLNKLDFDYVILNQQANEGRTIIEKIEAHSEVGFAIILLTPDDKCDIEGELEERARQNVMWEYGFFVGKLSRRRVCVLKRENVKIPSDLEGIGWIKFDSSDHWQVDLAKELKAAGYNIDMNDVIG